MTHRPSAARAAWPPTTPAALLQLLEANDGVVSVIDPPQEVRAAWRSVLHLLRRDGHIPDGWHLLHRGRDSGDLVIELRPGEHPSQRYRVSPSEPITVPDELVDPHPVVDALRDQPHRLPASQRNRSRALLLLEALAREALRRGHEVHASTPPTLMTVAASGASYGVEVFESSGARWELRLAVRIDGPGKGADEWADYAKRPVEQELSAILDEIDQRAAAVAAEQRDRERREEERLRREQEAILTRHRARLLHDEVLAWRQAQDIRWHCDQMVAAGLSPRDEWLTWARRYADDLDPTVDPRGMPAPPTEEELARERYTEQRRATAPARTEAPAPRPWHPNRRWWSQ
ncbi:hypothetical protein ACQEVZ_27805 [Dactylosporangium sp. CA-152071]|uniref:hypothetical protein n=1 Tax=Dactylosporangium sp. CA-152071 TaxID=3239933 RepID=UPI003D922F7D